MPAVAAAPDKAPVIETPSEPAEKATEAEAMAFVHAYSPSDLRRAAELRLLEEDFLPGLRKSPEIAEMLNAFPTLGPELQKTMAGQVDLYISEYDERFWPRAAAIVRSSLPRADVLDLTRFYRSPLGQKVLRLASENIDAQEVMERAIEDKPVDTTVMKHQATRAGLRTLAKLTDDERAQMVKLASEPAWKHFRAIVPQLADLNVELMNNPGPRFEKSSEKAMAETFKRVTGIDPSEH